MHAFRSLPSLAALTLGLPLLTPFSANAFNGCEWDATAPPGPMVFVRQFGTLYVPRDAPVGAVIGNEAVRGLDRPIGGLSKVQCWWEANEAPPEFIATPTVPLAPPPANSGWNYDPNKLLETDVPGIAVQMEYDSILGNNPQAAFKPIDNGRAIPPMHSHLWQPNVAFWSVYPGGNAWFTVVKTGALTPGPHTVSPRVLFNGSFSDIGHALSYAAEGTVIVAQCDVGATAPIEVDLGTWDLSHFTAPGTTTPVVPVTIALHSCQDDPSGSVATVHAQFRPQNGSAAVGDPLQGIFSLTTNATAAGVGVRLLKDDGSPMPLNLPIPMAQIPSNGATLDLNLGAQLYQTAPADQVRAGTIDGMLEFTLTYQ